MIFKNRHTIRLPDFDYASANAYFVTICAQNRECLFGGIVDGEMRLNDFGKIVEKTWNHLPKYYSNLELGTSMIMPNHFHGIVVLRADFKSAPTKIDISHCRGRSKTCPPEIRPPQPRLPKRHPLSEIVRAFKGFSSREINLLRNQQGVSIWQRNYHEHVIRNEADHNRICEYIISNPANWAEDTENPSVTDD